MLKFIISFILFLIVGLVLKKYLPMCGLFLMPTVAWEACYQTYVPLLKHGTRVKM